ncbi:MAG: hypothetical protein ACD_11C00006G0003 [uncultured bacterium]|nr:MAG: hypothetical protein ACD_11C00006G0003 [uncultured bacterium]HBR71699.1 hypothetical protein [Candidatus Moranbacteria bacterium]
MEERAKRIKRTSLKIFLTLFAVGVVFWIIFNIIKNNTVIFDTRVSILKSENVRLGDTVDIFFNGYVSEKDIIQSFKIDPADEIEYAWNKSAKKLSISPKKNWKQDTEYFLYLNNARNIFGFRFDAKLSFKTDSYPTVFFISPTENEKDVVIDIEDPISVNFNKNLEDYNVKFVVDPPIDLASQFNEQKTNIKLIPKKGLEKGIIYNIDVYVKHKKASENEYEQIYKSSFETKPEEIVQWDKSPEIKLSQAKRYETAKIKEGKYIDINLKNQVMVIFENGEALDSYLISSGKRGMETPQGSFRIYNKHPRPWSKKYSLFMPYWMAITSTGEFGIHELPEWPGGYKEGANHLGIPVSHGCVRLGVGPAKRVYEWAEISTPVIVHY